MPGRLDRNKARARVACSAIHSSTGGDLINASSGALCELWQASSQWHSDDDPFHFDLNIRQASIGVAVGNIRKV